MAYYVWLPPRGSRFDSEYPLSYLKRRVKLYVVYKTTNKINGKIYIGCHSTNNIEDGYLGSGRLLVEDIEKYGKENFGREIIKILEDRDEALALESSLVTKEFVQRKDTYNLKTGGGCDFHHLNSKPYIITDRRRITALENAKVATSKLKGYLEDPEYRKKWADRGRENLQNYHKLGLPGTNTGKSMLEETKRKIGKANSIHQKGKGNSQYGTCWIYSMILKQNKKIKKEELDKWLKEGWIKGRKMKF